MATYNTLEEFTRAHGAKADRVFLCDNRDAQRNRGALGRGGPAGERCGTCKFSKEAKRDALAGGLEAPPARGACAHYERMKH